MPGDNPGSNLGGRPAPFAEGAEELVAGLKTQAVVDNLEAVYAQEQHGGLGFGVLARALQGMA
jgi:hypothetical protein